MLLVLEFPKKIEKNQKHQKYTRKRFQSKGKSQKWLKLWAKRKRSNKCSAPPKPRAEGSSPSAPAKLKSLKNGLDKPFLRLF